MNTIKQIADQCATVFEAAETALKAWDFQAKNYQFPELVEAVSQALGISNDRDKKEIDGLVRYYVYRHDDYTSKRGAGGGVTLTALENAKRSTIEARKAAKAAAAAEIDKRTDSGSDSTDSSTSDEPASSSDTE